MTTGSTLPKVFPLSLLLLVEPFDKPALVQLRDKARVDELFRLVAADIGPSRRRDLVDRVQSFGYRIGRGDKIFPENSVRALQILRVAGAEIFRQYFLAEIFVLL